MVGSATPSPADVVLADLSRPSFEGGPGVYLFVWQCSGGPLVFAGRVIPHMKRGRLRRRVTVGGVHFSTADYGRSWWAVKCHQRYRYLDVDSAESAAA